VAELCYKEKGATYNFPRGSTTVDLFPFVASSLRITNAGVIHTNTLDLVSRRVCHSRGKLFLRWKTGIWGTLFDDQWSTMRYL
jgi:hypothetical protein